MSDLGLRCDEVVSNTGVPHRFYTPKIRRREISRRLSAFWEASCPVTSSTGVIGRFYHLSRDDIVSQLAENFSPELLDELESADLRAMARLLNNGDPFSPFGSAARRFLGS